MSPPTEDAVEKADLMLNVDAMLPLRVATAAGMIDPVLPRRVTFIVRVA